MRGRLLPWLAGLTLVGSCAHAPTAATVVDLGEFWLEPDHTTLSAGMLDLTVSNSGSYAHTLVVASEDGEVVAASDLIEPGTRAGMVVSLGPGEYSFTCRIVNGRDDGTVVDHYQEGMMAHVTVVGATG